MNRIATTLLVLAAARLMCGPATAEPAAGTVELRAAAGNSELVVGTAARLAGAIGSVRWGGQEFIDTADHGRELQSACSFDNGPGAGAETFNPTEAGSRDDGAGPATTSRLLALTRGPNGLRTRTQMAFWLAPGERSGGELARNRTKCSDYVLTKEVHLGVGRWRQALDYRVTFTLPPGGGHTNAQFEVLTGYMPEKFSQFWQFNPAAGRLEPLSEGPGEQSRPVVLATPDGRYAMGIYGVSGPGKMTYGRWRFGGAHVVKWNCVCRLKSGVALAAGDYAFQLRVPVGSVGEVEGMLRAWAR